MKVVILAGGRGSRLAMDTLRAHPSRRDLSLRPGAVEGVTPLRARSAPPARLTGTERDAALAPLLSPTRAGNHHPHAADMLIRLTAPAARLLGRRTPPRVRGTHTRTVDRSRTPTMPTDVRADMRVSCPAQIACHEDFRP
ncbi:MAG: hypothetical protein B7Y95_02560 [Rhizobiales bacterium 32-66-11]|nr:MAG: hypothetical protein B7Y95_02560 [Rhizobiales bacterium 32-66-11]